MNLIRGVMWHPKAGRRRAFMIVLITRSKHTLMMLAANQVYYLKKGKHLCMIRRQADLCCEAQAVLTVDSPE